MKFSHTLAILAAAGFITASAPSFAADGGIGTNKWTEADVKSLCGKRFPGKPKRYNKCLDRQKKHLGKDKTASDVQMLASPNGKAPK